ncbi:LysR family transcriptional regulator [Halopseudomonas oceani]|uniref:LysR family transcriptional regulator n=1 Tax=Halopseudomonas oceani TaxID=1708783 RepID=A0A2P4EVA3_9GAMM|nr:LysR family transcriptional regulator [Halopseudomonas oceani]POB03481.1 LysR family transcriptional regulator [Halopseudomonas oceani]GGE44784.1 LysR family transcriptional regulator [Halopseudomonas oceani]
MDRFQEMSVFEAVADELSMSAAGRRLQLSAPTITRAIDALEKRLGVALLRRSTRGVEVTPAGERFLADCRRILAEVADADRSASGLHTSPRGRLQVSMPLLFGQSLMTPILLEYLQAHPRVEVFGVYQDRVPNLHEEGIEVAVQVGALPDSSLFAAKVGDVRRIICASPDYLNQHGTPSHPEQLVDHQIVHSSADARTPEWQFVQQGGVKRYPLLPRLSCATNHAAIAAAERGAGLVRCMSYQVHESLMAGSLQPVLQRFELPVLPVHVVYREGRRAAARVRSFVDLAVARLRVHPALNSD